MAHVDAWENIRRHGLLSVSNLLDLFEVSGARRVAIESARRPESVVIEHAQHGRAIIRDNKPMDDVGLQRALEDMTPREWYELLNGKVFLWPSESRLRTLLAASAYRCDAHCVLAVDTRRLVERHRNRIWLSPMNSGCTKPFPHPRGSKTFRKIGDYPFDFWKNQKGSAEKSVVEFAIDGAIPDIAELVESVSIQMHEGVSREIYRRLA